MPGRAFIGTSGWNYDAWCDGFYPSIAVEVLGQLPEHHGAPGRRVAKSSQEMYSRRTMFRRLVK